MYSAKADKILDFQQLPVSGATKTTLSCLPSEFTQCHYLSPAKKSIF